MPRPLLVTTDVHACLDELVCLLEAVGYRARPEGIVPPPDGRFLLFAGDLVDRGPDPAACLLLLDRLVQAGRAQVAALGNHDRTLLQALRGEPLPARISGLPQTLAALLAQSRPQLAREATLRLFAAAPLCSVDRERRLAISHAALLPEDLAGDGRAGYLTDGIETAERDELGRTVKDFAWAERWRGSDWRIVVGHNTTRSRRPGALAGGAVVALDTGCVFGGALSGWLWPEDRYLAVPALTAWAERPGEIRAELAPLPVETLHVDPARTALWRAHLAVLDTRPAC